MTGSVDAVSRTLQTKFVCFILLFLSSLTIEADERVAKALVTTKAFFEQFHGKQFVIDWRALKQPNHFEPTGIKVSAWVYGSSKARFGSTYLHSKTLDELNREYLFQENGQALYADQYKVFQDGIPRNSRPNVAGDFNWADGPKFQFSNLFWLGQIWNGDRFVNMCNPEVFDGARVDVDTENGQVVVALQPAGANSLRVRFNDKIDRLLSIEYVEKEEEWQSISELTIVYSEAGDFEYLRWANDRAKEDSAFYVLEKTDTAKLEGALKFANIEIRNGHDVDFFPQESTKYRYFDGCFQKVVDERALNKIEEILSGAKKRQFDRGVHENVLAKGAKADNYLSDFATNFHCGAYSFCAAAALLSKNISIVDLIADRRLVGHRGATVEGIEECALAYSLNTSTFRNADFSLLDSVDAPVMLHLKSRMQIEETAHWVVFVGKQGDDYLILDLPHETVAMSPAMLQTSWDGIAVSISDKPISFMTRVSCWLSYILRNFAAPLLFLTFAWILSMRLGGLWQPPNRNIVFQLTLIFLTALMSTAFWFWASPLSYGSNLAATSFAMANWDFDKKEFKLLYSQHDLDKWIEGGGLLIDARMPKAFETSRIKNAVNLPVNAGILQLTDFSEKNDHDQPIVVYCNDDQCDWAKQLAGVLSEIGFTDISVYVPGIKSLVTN